MAKTCSATRLLTLLLALLDSLGLGLGGAKTCTATRLLTFLLFPPPLFVATCHYNARTKISYSCNKWRIPLGTCDLSGPEAVGIANRRVRRRRYAPMPAVFSLSRSLSLSLSVTLSLRCLLCTPSRSLSLALPPSLPPRTRFGWQRR